MTVNELVDKVVAGIKPEWDDLHKIRYVYIEVGKVVARDTDFFFSVDNKLGQDNLSYDELKAIYESDEGRNMAVICKSAAMILKRIYDRLGIESWLVRSNNNFQELTKDDEVLDIIYHWFLAVKDGDKVYFLTLNTDLANIQMGFETEHFGIPIQYTREVKGETVQVYSGEKINETVIPREVLEQVDKDIGYIRHSYNYDKNEQKTDGYSLQYENASLGMLRDALRGDKLYFELERYDTDLYRKLILNFIGVNGGRKVLFANGYNNLSEEDWDLWRRKFCRLMYDRICYLLGYEVSVIPYPEDPNWTYDRWLLRLCVVLQEDIFKYYDIEGINDYKDIRINVEEEFKYTKWSTKVKKKFNNKSKAYDYNNVLLMIDRMNTLMCNTGPNANMKNFRVMFNYLTYNFMPPEHVLENSIDEDGMLSNAYIANKFRKLFTKVFSCNNEVTPFNNMGYSEQVVVIKKIIEYFFPEITRENSCKIEEYSDKYTPIANRIHIYPVKSKDDGNYSIVFNIIGQSRYDDYYFLYDLKTNKFRPCDIFDVSMRYIIISERMKNRMSAIDLEYLGTQKK